MAVNITKFFEVQKIEVCEDFTHCGCDVITRYNFSEIYFKFKISCYFINKIVNIAFGNLAKEM